MGVISSQVPDSSRKAHIASVSAWSVSERERSATPGRTAPSAPQAPCSGGRRLADRIHSIHPPRSPRPQIQRALRRYKGRASHCCTEATCTARHGARCAANPACATRRSRQKSRAGRAPC
ncbi:hypothetical protein T492DRAFT_1054948 [Pavlovales sp. CCMP2436]|nr:hypothetical protein T492DRAFT_1054948 [Pavlovales sp. CCMP2436]